MNIVSLTIESSNLGVIAVRLLLFLFFKHFIADFCLQPPYMYRNKGNIRHPGGYLHALLHVYFTTFILWFFKIDTAVIFTLGVVEFLVHYWTDWAKVNINKATGWTATTSEGFWILLGLDQFIHSLTYLGMVWYVIKVLSHG
jgi:hypothetical protein